MPSLAQKFIQIISRALLAASAVVAIGCSGGGGGGSSSDGGGSVSPPSASPADTTTTTMLVTTTTLPIAFSPSISIEAGALITRNSSVNLTLSASGADEMLISQDVTCNSGTWEAFATSKAWPLDAMNSNNSIYFKVRASGQESACVSSGILHDNVAPVVDLVSISEGAYLSGGAVSAVSFSGSCSENGQPVGISGPTLISTSCAAGSYSVSADLSSWADGSIAISIGQLDAAGNVGGIVRNVVKDTVAPSISFTAPVVNGYANAANAHVFSFNGACSENGQSVSISGAINGSANCNSNLWSASGDVSGLADGAFSISISHLDVAGNVSNSSRSFNKDVVAPTAPSLSINAGAAYTNLSSVNLDLSSVDTAEMLVSNDSACAVGSWQSLAATLPWTISGGNSNVSVYAKFRDLAGNETACVSGSIIHDSNVPVLAYTSPAANSYINALNVSSFAISGSCSEEGSTVSISGAVVDSVVCTSGLFAKNLDLSAVADGAVSIVVSQVDLSGNSGNASRSFVKSTAPPTVGWSLPLADAYINSAAAAAVSISGTCSDNTRPVDISGAASTSVSCSAGVWSATVDVSASADGAISLTAAQTDVANNTSSSSRSFNKDTVAPAPVSLAINGGALVTNSAAVVLDLSATSAAEMFVSNDSSCSTGTWEAMAATKNWTLSATNQSVSVYAKYRDAALNESSCVSASIAHDNVVPLMAFSAPAANSFVNSNAISAFDVSGTCSEEGVAVDLSGAVLGSATCTSGVWSKTVDLSALSQGNLTITVSQTDSAGNIGSSARVFVKDTVAPAPVSLSINSASPATNNTAVTLNLTATGATEMLISDDVLCLVGVYESFSATKPWTLQMTNSLSSVFVKYRDAAMNDSACVSGSIVHDDIPPTLAFLTPAVDAYVNSIEQTAFNVTGDCSEGTRNVTFTGAATGSAVCTAGSFSANLNFSAAAQGAVVLTATHTDLAGNSISTNRQFQKDTVGPTGNSISIQAGDANTNLTTVALTLASSSAVEMYVTEDSACATGGSWEAFATSKSFPITIVDAVAAVYVQYKDIAGNTSACVNDSILQDSTAPDWIDVPTHASIFSSLTDSPTATYLETANDAGSGVSKYQYAIGTGTSGAALNDKLDWADASGGAINATGMTLTNATTYYINMRVVDMAGNISPVLSSAGWLVDTTPPTLTVVSPLEASYFTDIDFKVNGVCDSLGSAVTVSYSAGLAGDSSVTCTAGVYYFFAKFTSVGASSFTVSQSDAVNTANVTVNVSYQKPVEIGGQVLKILPLSDGSVIYGGAFKSVTVDRDPNLVKVDLDGTFDSSFDHGSGFNGNVYSVIQLADGSIVAGGDFTRYRGRTANRIAKIDSAGNLDTTFNPQTGGNGFNSTVLTMVATATHLYVGGSFTTYRSGTTNATRIAKLDLTGVLDTSFTLVNSGASSTVRSIYGVGSDLYIGGDFTTYRGGVANRIAKLDLGGAMDLTFNPATGGNGANNSVYSITGNGTDIFFGGTFTTYRGTAANRVAKITAAGVLDTVFNPTTGNNGANSTVNSVLLNGTDLYIGGAFTTYRAAVANRVAKISATGVLDTAFNPAAGANGASGTVETLATDGTSIYLGGQFVNYRGQQVNYVTKVSSAGVLDATFSPTSGASGTSYFVHALNIASGKLWIGGGFTQYRRLSYVANNLVRIMSNGTVDTTLSPQSGASGFGSTVRDFALNSDSTILYVAGDFTSYKGQIANYAAKISTVTGDLDTTFSPQSGSNGMNSISRAVALADDNQIFFGGDFTQYRATAANYVTKVDASGVKDTVFSPNSGSNGTAGSSKIVYDLLVSGGNLFIGGAYTTYRGSTQNRIAKVAMNGILDTTFNPTTGTPGFSSTVTAIATDGTSLYFSGAFTTFRAAPAKYVAKLSTAGVLDTVFNPPTGSNGASTTVNQIALCNNGSSISIVGVGGLTSYRGATATYVFKADQNGVLDTTFNGGAGLNGFAGPLTAVNSVACDNGNIYMGGAFQFYRGKAFFNSVKTNYSGVRQ